MENEIDLLEGGVNSIENIVKNPNTVDFGDNNSYTVAVGSKIYQGSGLPNNNSYLVADWYLNIDNGFFYEKTGVATWTYRMTLKGADGVGGSEENYTLIEKNKLAGIATGAEVNVNSDWNAVSGDAQILNKPTIPSIEGLASETYVNNADNLKVDKVAGKSLIDDSEISRLASMTAIFTGALKTAYDSAVTWISANGASLIAHLSRTDNPHSVTKTQLGLGNVDNTSDANKPISSATQTALNNKEPLKGIDDNYVTDAEKVVIGNTSGTNTGDNAVNSNYSGLAASKENTITGGTTAQYWRGDKTFQTLDKNAVGLGNVPNLSFSGSNTGDETTGTIQTKRPIKTVNGNSLEGSGNITISGGGGSNISIGKIIALG